MSEFNSASAVTCADLQSKNPNTELHYKAKTKGSKIGLLLTSIIIFCVLQFFIVDLKTDFWGEAYTRFIASDLVEANYKIDTVYEITKKKKRGGKTKSYTAEISYTVDGTQYKRSIPGIHEEKDIKKMTYKYSKAFPALGYTEANTFTFYFDLIFLGSALIFIFVSLIMVIVSKLSARARLKNAKFMEVCNYAGVVKKNTEDDLYANYYLSEDRKHCFISEWNKGEVKEPVASNDAKLFALFKDNSYTILK